MGGFYFMCVLLCLSVCLRVKGIERYSSLINKNTEKERPAREHEIEKERVQ